MNARVLSEQQLQQFRRDGYLFVQGMYAPAAVAEIARWTEQLAGSPEPPAGLEIFRSSSEAAGESCAG